MVEGRCALKTHNNYARVQEAMADESTWACIRELLARLGDDPGDVADPRYRSPGEETIRDTLTVHPGADGALVRAYFLYRP
jgi:hypothetical protein